MTAKIDLYIAIVGETFIRDIFSSLAFLEQTFETDKKVFKVANDKFRIKNKLMALEDVKDIDDFNVKTFQPALTQLLKAINEG